jgi:ABC-2 type transport system permease protein
MKSLLLIYAEFLKIIGDIKSYWFNYIFGNLNIFFMFLGLLYSFSFHMQSKENIFMLLFGMMIWYYGVHAIDLIAIIVEEEIEEGTLQQIYMTKTTFIKVLFNRVVSQIFFDTIKGVFVFILCLFTFKIPLEFLKSIYWLPIILIFIFTIIGLYGLGYMIAGLSLVFKQTMAVASSCSNLLLFFTGITIPFESLPPLAKYCSKLLPTYYGMGCLKKIILYDFSLKKIIVDISFVYLLICCCVWICIGIIAFKLSEKQMKKQGTINQY